ncbi:MAG: M15 family metallopeptidase [Verrucomicrobiota bacterium]
MIPLPPVEEEQGLIALTDNGNEFFLHPDAAHAWMRLKEAAASENVQLELVSAFRSVARQAEIIENKRKRGIPDSDIFRINAPAGFSEHHSGRAIDISTTGFAPLEEEFENSEAFKWLSKRAIDFGFSMSYPRENRFGIAYEPWHWFYQSEVE